MAERKTSRGRQKIEIKKIEKRTARDTCFTKRRNGLFKKASKICTNCDAQVAIVAFSRGGKAYSFGHPSVDSVVNRFLMDVGATETEQEQEQEQEDHEEQEEQEENFVSALTKLCSLDITGLELEELERFYQNMQEISELLNKKIQQFSTEASSSSTA